jgi:poly(A) polymerase
MTDEIEAKRQFAREVVNTLRARGFVALWAGGCVRDLLMGQTPADYDVATDAPAPEVMRIFPRNVPVGVSFGVVRVLNPRGHDQVEVATFRTDGCYLDGRRPESVHFGTPEADAARRDFTINGMFLDPATNEVIDFVGGRADLSAGVVRAIGDPHARFSEDKLRLIRAVRFASRFQFQIEPKTHAGLVAMAGELRVVAVERFTQELRRMLEHPSRAIGMRMAMETGLLDAWLPELSALRQQQTPPGWRSHDLWEHTLAVLQDLHSESTADFTLGLAALFHELSADEPGAFRVDSPRGKASEPNRGTTRAEVPSRPGAIADSLCTRMRISNDERARVVWLVKQQRELWGLFAASPSVRKRLLANDAIADLLRLHRADARAEGQACDALDRLTEYRSTLPEGPLNPPPLVNGADLKRLGVLPGPAFKQLLERVRDAQLDGRVTSHADAVELVRGWINP